VPAATANARPQLGQNAFFDRPAAATAKLDAQNGHVSFRAMPLSLARI
jgi:hypothetical protein